jgi:hypothetical protein
MPKTKAKVNLTNDNFHRLREALEKEFGDCIDQDFYKTENGYQEKETDIRASILVFDRVEVWFAEYKHTRSDGKSFPRKTHLAFYESHDLDHEPWDGKIAFAYEHEDDAIEHEYGMDVDFDDIIAQVIKDVAELKELGAAEYVLNPGDDE